MSKTTAHKKTHPEYGPGDVEKRSISASSGLLKKAEAIMHSRSITNFSEYVRSLILRDIEGQSDHAHKGKPA